METPPSRNGVEAWVIIGVLVQIQTMNLTQIALTDRLTDWLPSVDKLTDRPTVSLVPVLMNDSVKNGLCDSMTDCNSMNDSLTDWPTDLPP